MSTTKTEKNERDKFVIKLAENVPFEAAGETKFITSTDFCKLVSELFRGVFDDFEGCTLDVSNGKEPSISLYFNHGKYDDDATLACHRKEDDKSVANSVIRNMRRRDTQMKDGDRYYLTEDGLDVVKDLLTPRAFNNGKPSWGSIVQDIVDRTAVSYYMPQHQIPSYTRVSFISIERLCGLIYGRNMDNGDQFDYQVNIGVPTNQMNYTFNGIPMGTTNYVLTITRASLKEVSKMADKLGYSSMMGTNIIR